MLPVPSLQFLLPGSTLHPLYIPAVSLVPLLGSCSGLVAMATISVPLLLFLQWSVVRPAHLLLFKKNVCASVGAHVEARV